MSDHDKLREAIERARYEATVRDPAPSLCRAEHLLALADAAESTLPKTKMVEVWHVERAVMGVHLFVSVCASRSGAESQAGIYEQDPTQKCVRVTGPHTHEVPK